MVVSRQVTDNGTYVSNCGLPGFLFGLLAKTAWASSITAHNLVSYQFRSANDQCPQITVNTGLMSWHRTCLNSGEKIALLSGVKTYRNVFLATLTALAVTVPARAAEGKGPEKVDRALAGSLKPGGQTENPNHDAARRTRERQESISVRAGASSRLNMRRSTCSSASYTTEEILDLAKRQEDQGFSARRAGLRTAAHLADRQPGWFRLGRRGEPDQPVVDARFGHDDAAPDAGPVGRRQRWNAPTGSGIGVAIIDSGIAPSADFAGRITGVLRFHERAQRLSVSRRMTTTATARTSPG